MGIIIPMERIVKKLRNGEFISREAAKEAVVKAVGKGYSPFNAIVMLPAADVRPVVTCGECKYWELSKIEPPFHVCTYVCGATFVRATVDFCSRGEKREES